MTRKVSVGRLAEVEDPHSASRTTVIALLAVVGFVLAGLFVYLFRIPDPAEAPVPAPVQVPVRPGPTAMDPDRKFPDPGEPMPFAGFLSAGLMRERLEAAAPPAVSEEAADVPESPAEAEALVLVPPGTRGVAAIAGAVYGTLTLQVLEDLAARNPDVPDWNRLDTSRGLLLPEGVPASAEPVDFYTVQVASFRQEGNIRRTASRLCANDVLNVFILRPDPAAEEGDPGRGWFRCYAGVFASPADADDWKGHMRRSGFRDAFVTRMRGVPLRDIHVPCP